MTDVKLATVALAAANEGRIPLSVLLGTGRPAGVVEIRHAGMLVARRLRPDVTLPMIARTFCRTDHSTVVNAIHRAADLERKSQEFASLIAAITDRALRGDVVKEDPPLPEVQPSPRPPIEAVIDRYKLPRAVHANDDPPEP